MFHIIKAFTQNFGAVTKSRLFKMAGILIFAILFLAYIYWLVEKSYQEPGFSYLDALRAIAIFTISGFDTDPPNTLLGWGSAVFSLLFGIVLVGSFTAEIASIFVESRLKDHSAVKSISYTDHIIVCGHLADPYNFVSQFYHPDRNNTTVKLVFLFSYSPSAQMEIVLNNQKFKNKIKYVIGSPLITSDLEKVNAHKAKSAFIFTNRFVEDYDKQDANTILTALSIEAYNKDIETYVQILKSCNLDSLLATGADNFIVIDALSSNLFAQSCLNPGLSELIRNLLISSTEDDTDHLSKKEIEYKFGAGQEIYKISIGSGLVGETFSIVSAIVYNKYELAVIAVENSADDNEYKFAVNPGDDWVLQSGDNVFVIADDYEDAEKISLLDDKLEHKFDISKGIEHGNHVSGWRGEIISHEDSCKDKVEFDNHIIICGNINNLELLIDPLRSDDLVSFQRLVILNDRFPAKREWEVLSKYNEIYYVQGSPYNYKDLNRINIDNADKAIILSDTQQEIIKGEENYCDANTIMSVMAIETAHEGVYTISELLYFSNIKFIKPEIGALGGSDNRFSVDEVIDVSMIADSMIMQEFYTARSINIFNEIFSIEEDDEDRNTCEVYQIPIPSEMKGKSYGELFLFLSIGYNIISIGLYRADDEDPFVFTNPAKDVLLNENDRIYVLSPDQPVID
tara:strand:+ start:143 stop:2191 length:2049 start_codon:yes stop_codon:yes gene_type:complete